MKGWGTGRGLCSGVEWSGLACSGVVRAFGPGGILGAAVVVAGSDLDGCGGGGAAASG